MKAQAKIICLLLLGLLLQSCQEFEPEKEEKEPTETENTNGSENLTIQKIGKDNPTLLYKGKPLLATGPVSENRIFMYKWGSKVFDHQAWLDWMQKYKFKMARVFPNSVWKKYQSDDKRENRMYPFKVVSENGAAVKVDLMKMDDAHWKNFAKILHEFEKRDIIVGVQVYQRYYIQDSLKKEKTHGQGLFYNKKYNVNGVNDVSHKTFWKNSIRNSAMIKIHENWVNAILESIKGKYARDFGDSDGRKNVLIDLMNEGSIREGVPRKWINKTMDIIKKWEQKNGRDILVGMDMDHFWAVDSRDDIKFVMGHKDMELIIGEDHWIYEVGSIKDNYKNILHARKIFNKPLIWMNEKDNRYNDTFTLTDHPNRRRHYIWAGLMLKVQGLGMYEKEDFVKRRLLGTRQAAELGEYNLFLMDFFYRIKDYAKLQVDLSKISSAPSPSGRGDGEFKPLRLCLASSKEVIVYLHDHWKSSNKGGTLKLKNLDSALNGSVNIAILHLSDSKTVRTTGSVSSGVLTINLPKFYENLAVHIYK